MPLLSSLLFIPLLSLDYFVGASQEILVEQPFYLRARVHDAHSASVQFEIAQANQQRSCERYQFTVRRNNDDAYAMPEQNLTFWRNSLELKDLDAGRYRVCAIICSETNNRSVPITTCVQFDAFRSHFLVLTLYVLVLTFLGFSHMIFSLRKRKLQARITMALIEVENSMQKRRATQSSTPPDRRTPAGSILHSIVHLPAAPIEPSANDSSYEQGPPVFHLHMDNEHSAPS